MGLNANQISNSIIEIVNKEKSIFNQAISIQDVNHIPENPPIENPSHWMRVKDVICVYTDLIGSTKLSAIRRTTTTAKVYRLFTQTITNIFHSMEAPYIDIKGDGVFALFNFDQVYRAFVSAIHIKTFVEEEFLPLIKGILSEDESGIGAHLGIDQKTVLVRKIGLKMINRSDRQNEVWAGKPVNMASKLASLSKDGELYVSERYFSKISSDYARYCCKCSEKTFLWKEVELNDSKFDFEKAYILTSKWCNIHGKEYAEELLKLD